MVVVERSVATFLHLPRTFNHQLVPPVFFRIGAAVVSLRLCFPSLPPFTTDVRIIDAWHQFR